MDLLSQARRLPLVRQTTGNNSSSRSLPFGIELGDSVGILGMRQSGKTYLGTHLYQQIMETHTDACGYVIDSNANGDFTGWSGGYFGLDCPIIYPSERGRQVVWQPPYDSSEAYEEFFAKLYDARIPSVLMIDELSSLGKGSHDFYSRLLKRGRRRSNFPGITVISLSQEFAQKANVPRTTFSQLNHFFKFYVQHPYDIQESNKMMHLPMRVQPEHVHGFWHIRLDRVPIKPTYYPKLEIR